MTAIGTLPVVLGTGVHGSRPAASAVGKGGLYSCTTHSLVYQTDGSSWTTWATLGSSGGVATDPIWDAAGDIVRGTGADTASRLALGNVGGRLSRLNGVIAWDSGTSNPTGAAGDRYYRSDLGLEILYTGTQWVSQEIFRSGGSLAFTVPATANNTTQYIAMQSGFDIAVGTFHSTTLVLTTNNGSQYWTCTLNKTNAANSPTSLGSFNTSADTATTWVPRATAINANVAAGTYKLLQVDVAKTSTPGNLYFDFQVDWRLVIT